LRGGPKPATDKWPLFLKKEKNKMNFLSKLLRGIAFVPAVVHGIEALFGGKSGGEKREAALSFVGPHFPLPMPYLTMKWLTATNSRAEEK